MPIDPTQLARSLGALDRLDVAQGFARPLQQVLGSVKTLLDADRAGLMLVDQAGALRWAIASDGGVQAVAGDLDRLATGPCRTAFTQRGPAAVGDRSATPGWHGLVDVDEGFQGALSVPVQVGGGPVGTLDVYATTPKQWDDSEAAALQAYAGLVASLLAAGVAVGVKDRLSDRLQAALAHRSLIEQAVEVVVDREGVDAPAAFGWLETEARSLGCAVVQVAGEVVGGAPLPSDRLAQAKAQRHTATDLEVAVHLRDSERHEDAAQRYQRRGQAGRAQTERLQAAAARGRITDAEAERHRADQEP
jgi:GAF domain-containing protein/ANTAR domain-containing protein